MNGFFVGSPVLPIIIRRRRPVEPERRLSDLSNHTLKEATGDEKSLKSQVTASSRGSKSSSGSRRRLHRLRRFFSWKKQAFDYEKMDDVKPKKTVKKYEETQWDHYYAGMQYGCWF